MMLLVSLAITVAFVASAASALGLFDLEFWWELSALVVIMLLGHWQEMKALGQARGALSALAELLPDEAERVRDGETERVSLDELELGDVVLVRPGARVPADGEIVVGEAELDESMITGESKPVPKSEGDTVTAGTVATDSAIHVRVTAVGDETALAGDRATRRRGADITFAHPGDRRSGRGAALLHRGRCRGRHVRGLGAPGRRRGRGDPHGHGARHLRARTRSGWRSPS